MEWRHCPSRPGRKASPWAQRQGKGTGTLGDPNPNPLLQFTSIYKCSGSGHPLCPGLGTHCPPHTKLGDLASACEKSTFLKHLLSTNPSLQSLGLPLLSKGWRGPLALLLAGGACFIHYTNDSAMPLPGPRPQTHLPLPSLLFLPHLGTDSPCSFCPRNPASLGW